MARYGILPRDKKGNTDAQKQFCIFKSRPKCREGETVNIPIHVTDDAFEQTVLKSPIPVIVDFWAPWCGPCKMVAPILDNLAQEFDGKVIIAKVNTDENSKWAGQYGVQGIPTMLFVSGGKEVHRQVGAMPERLLRQTVTQFLEIAGQNKA